jgi:hypothetical protein
VEGPGDWVWSSYRGTAGIDKPHPILTIDWILGQMGKRKREAVKRYRAFVRDGMGEGEGAEHLGGGGFHQSVY